MIGVTKRLQLSKTAKNKQKQEQTRVSICGKWKKKRILGENREIGEKGKFGEKEKFEEKGKNGEFEGKNRRKFSLPSLEKRVGNPLAVAMQVTLSSCLKPRGE